MYVLGSCMASFFCKAKLDPYSSPLPIFSTTSSIEISSAISSSDLQTLIKDYKSSLTKQQVTKRLYPWCMKLFAKFLLNFSFMEQYSGKRWRFQSSRTSNIGLNAKFKFDCLTVICFFFFFWKNLSSLSDEWNYNLLRLYNYFHRYNCLYSSPYAISAHVSTMLLLNAFLFVHL